jgi:hypothetical protein
VALGQSKKEKDPAVKNRLNLTKENEIEGKSGVVKKI